MRSALAIFFSAAAFACSDPSQLLIVEVDADLPLIHEVRLATVTVLDQGAPTDSTVVPVGGAWPDCFPFSIGVEPRNGQEDAPLTVSVEADMKGGMKRTKSITTVLADGTRYVK